MASGGKDGGSPSRINTMLQKILRKPGADSAPGLPAGRTPSSLKAGGSGSEGPTHKNNNQVLKQFAFTSPYSSAMRKAPQFGDEPEALLRQESSTADAGADASGADGSDSVTDGGDGEPSARSALSSSSVGSLSQQPGAAPLATGGAARTGLSSSAVTAGLSPSGGGGGPHDFAGMRAKSFLRRGVTSDSLDASGRPSTSASGAGYMAGGGSTPGRFARLQHHPASGGFGDDVAGEAPQGDAAGPSPSAPGVLAPASPSATGSRPSSRQGTPLGSRNASPTPLGHLSRARRASALCIGSSGVVSGGPEYDGGGGGGGGGGAGSGPWSPGGGGARIARSASSVGPSPQALINMALASGGGAGGQRRPESRLAPAMRELLAAGSTSRRARAAAAGEGVGGDEGGGGVGSPGPLGADGGPAGSGPPSPALRHQASGLLGGGSGSGGGTLLPPIAGAPPGGGAPLSAGQTRAGLSVNVSPAMLSQHSPGLSASPSPLRSGGGGALTPTPKSMTAGGGGSPYSQFSSPALGTPGTPGGGGGVMHSLHSPAGGAGASRGGLASRGGAQSPSRVPRDTRVLASFFGGGGDGGHGGGASGSGPTPPAAGSAGGSETNQGAAPPPAADVLDVESEATAAAGSSGGARHHAPPDAATVASTLSLLDELDRLHEESEGLRAAAHEAVRSGVARAAPAVKLSEEAEVRWSGGPKNVEYRKRYVNKDPIRAGAAPVMSELSKPAYKAAAAAAQGTLYSVK